MSFVDYTLIDVFVVWSDSDSSEGRGPKYISNICLSQEAATRCAKGKGVWGDAGEIRKGKAVVINGLAYPLDRGFEITPDDPIEEARRAALKKLTREEQELLGLK